ncbi:hypothetical protein WS0833 [Wolinella succinogenes]|uniref:Uncharacterized protein n=1 Tax=Wolinella succinogenes (strain ATCC 29543 / DSM 1740 / CCUG 13145 / JCM 31913 / LMG 7466 / NCTC 11488 / FDC 602W) TaxID=273121 RepID=Q7MS31_WOLSU|nr:hypothetical protein WS0833 [Wolinella succinogenes]
MLISLIWGCLEFIVTFSDKKSDVLEGCFIFDKQPFVGAF